MPEPEPTTENCHDITILQKLREDYINLGVEVARFQRMLSKDATQFETEHAAALAASGIDAMIAGDGAWPEGGVKHVIRTFATGVLKEGVGRAYSEITKLKLRSTSPESLWKDIIGGTEAERIINYEN